jgi:hypothetical protein
LLSLDKYPIFAKEEMMNIFRAIRFWQLMVGIGLILLIIGLVMIFLPPGVGDSDPFTIVFFEARIEGTEMGLALIVLGLSCFLIGRKDLADLRTVQAVQTDLKKTSTLAARLVAGQVEKTFDGLPTRPSRLASLPDLDVVETRQALKKVQNGTEHEGETARIIDQAENGLALLQALEKEGYSV